VGRLIALQIKSGGARLSQLRRDGRWTMYGEKRHLSRWLEYPIPVLIVLYDPARRTAYWQHVNDRTTEWTPGGFKVDVPEAQRLDVPSRETLRAVAEQWVPHRGTARSRALQAIAMRRVCQCRRRSSSGTFSSARRKGRRLLRRPSSKRIGFF
jgi:hypothetical protein